MINVELTIALIIVEVVLVLGFFGVILTLSRFSTQIKDNTENSFELLTGDINKLRAELRSYHDEVEALSRAQKEKNKDSNKV